MKILLAALLAAVAIFMWSLWRICLRRWARRDGLSPE